MNSKFLFLIATLLFGFTFVYAQGTYDIVFPGNDTTEKCQRCLQTFNEATEEVQFSIKRERDNLYFEVNDRDFFNALFVNDGDGLAIDIVLRDRYACDVESIKKAQIRGYLLKPVYAQQLISGLESSGNDYFRVHVGKVPEGFLGEEMEYNILFLSNKNLCEYYTIYDLESYPWGLLDMGMYLDDITYNPKQIKSNKNEDFVLNDKRLKFKIPFEKNKSNYSQTDIKPLYDSLRLEGFNIKAINIKAYSSVEGGEAVNMKLQERRANSIVSVLQAFQKKRIETNVSLSENWVEFLNDIKGTKHEVLSSLSKGVIRAKLVGALAKELEPILSHHRKAVLELELQKKDSYEDDSSDVLLVKFNEAIKGLKLDEASRIQNSIFRKLKYKGASLSILEKMNIPNEVKYAKISNKNSAYKYMINVRQAVIVYDELLELEKIAPKEAGIKYNIAAVKLKLWRFKALEVDEISLKRQINMLQSYGIDSTLISRMMVNFHIIKAERLMRIRDYSNKDKSIAYINSNYKNFMLSNYDYSSLAQFFGYYGNTNMSVELLKNKTRTIDIDEDLLFYYLNLTMVNNDLTKDLDYRIIMLNAINMNKERFCKLFNSVERGGVTFQLLEDDYLRGTYCENCKN